MCLALYLSYIYIVIASSMIVCVYKRERERERERERGIHNVRLEIDLINYIFIYSYNSAVFCCLHLYI